MKYYVLLLLAFLSACAVVPEDVQLTPSSFNTLPGWENDQHDQSLAALKKSCARILKNDPDRSFHQDPIWGTYGDWQVPCKALREDNLSAQDFYQDHFTPFKIKGEGLFTGYYEPLLHGSRTQVGKYQTPLRARPDDLVMVQLGEFRDDLKGRRIAGRVVNGKLRVYEDRAEIGRGELPKDQDEVLVYVDDLVDAFFLEIQGSGRIQLDTGEQIRLGYAGQNGHSYYAIGRELIKREELTKENVSLQSIRQWLYDNPADAQEIMNTNASYVFFQELDGDGPLGGEGIALTPKRSLAIDRSLLAYGLPLWVDIDHPDTDKDPFRKVMISQDTGGAIRGPVRGDYFWGFGEDAEYYAGIMKSRGEYWVLLPNSLAERSFEAR